MPTTFGAVTTRECDLCEERTPHRRITDGWLCNECRQYDPDRKPGPLGVLAAVVLAVILIGSVWAAAAAAN